MGSALQFPKTGNPSIDVTGNRVSLKTGHALEREAIRFSVTDGDSLCVDVTIGAQAHRIEIGPLTAMRVQEFITQHIT
jgi:hypothetical protein